MNRTHRTVWSSARQAYVAAPETAKSAGKTSTRKALMAPALLSLAAGVGTAAWAVDLPTAGQVVGGSGSISTAGSQMTIHQSTAKMAIDWQSFNIGQGKTVEFVQPSVSSVALNRVLGTDVSVIQGALKANGQVFLVNPNGVLFTPTAQVNVGGIVASTLNISNQHFLDGNYRFAGRSSSAIVNQGDITAHGDGAAGGTVALIAAKITNTGQINAERGNVLMGAGSTVRLDLGGPVKIEVEEGAIDALIEQGGGVRADSGLVYLTAKALGQLTTTVINHTGITEARTLATGEQGQIYLMGGMDKDRIVVGGTLDASALNGGDGGFIETSSANVQIQNDFQITTHANAGRTGSWLIDPADITVVSSGGNITGAALSAALGSGGSSSGTNVILDTTGSGACTGITCSSLTSGNGDIFINDSVTWDSNKTLTLKAYRNIEINAGITSSDSSGKLALEYGQGGIASGNAAIYLITTPIRLQDGSNFSTKLGNDGTVVNYTVITGPTVNATLLANLSGNYALGADLSLAAPAPGSSNWTPVGTLANPFAGKFEGLGHVISNLMIDLPSSSNVGLFGYTSGASIGNVGLTNASVIGKESVGGLVGYLLNSHIKNAYIKGAVTGNDGFNNTGGLVGYSSSTSSITGSYSAAEVEGGNVVGGLVGSNEGLVDYSYALGNVIANGRGFKAGGLAGENTSIATITNSYATGSVTVTNDLYEAGGLVGENLGNISNSYATGDVGPGERPSYDVEFVGGLVGASWQGSIENSYATGAVKGSGIYEGVGGLVGTAGASTSITSSYATGPVTGIGSTLGGLVGSIYGSPIIQDSFWDKTTTQLETSAGGGTGLANTDAYNVAKYIGFDFVNKWWMVEGATRPLLRMEYSTTITNAHQLQLMAMDPAGNYKLASNINLGTALSNPSDVWKGGYDSNGQFQGSFSPIKGPVLNSQATPFTGTFDGRNYTISGLFINLQAAAVGLFGRTQNATLKNINLASPVISGQFFVGALVGDSLNTSIENASVTSGTVEGEIAVGGLVGLAREMPNGGISTITQSFSSASVTGSGTSVGGLIGGLYDSSLTNSYASGDVTGDFEVGGLIGFGLNVSVVNASALGNVKANSSTNGRAGGLIGGLGSAQSKTNIVTNSFSSGKVEGNGTNGGLIGFLTPVAEATFTNNFWDVTTSGQTNGVNGASVSGVTGKTTAEMQNIATYAGWAIEDQPSYSGDIIYPRLTMSGSSSVWRIKSVGGGGGGGNQSDADAEAAVQAAAQAAAEAAAKAAAELAAAEAAAKAVAELAAAEAAAKAAAELAVAEAAAKAAAEMAAAEAAAKAAAELAATQERARVLSEAQARAQAQLQGQLLSSLPSNTSSASPSEASSRDRNALGQLFAPVLPTNASVVAQVNGGLVLLNDGGTAAGGANQGSEEGSDTEEERRQQNASAASTQNAGRDASGFMRLWLIRGGVNMDFSKNGGN